MPTALAAEPPNEHARPGGRAEQASLGKPLEETEQEWLYAPVWPVVNRHYAHLAIPGGWPGMARNATAAP